MTVETHQHPSTEAQEQPARKKIKKHKNLERTRTLPSFHQNVPKHPLGIKPSGNIILAKDEDLKLIGESAGALFSKLPDDVILNILGMLNKKDLSKASQVSRFWYAYATFDELWRNMYTSKTPAEREETEIQFSKWRGSWRSSILNFDENVGAENAHVNCEGLVYSDALFTPYVNSCINYKQLFAEVIEEQLDLKNIEGYWDASLLDSPEKFPHRGRIPRIEEDTFTYDMFEKNQWNDHPFILGSNKAQSAERWPKWTIKYLLDKFPDVKFRQESVVWELERYEQYANENRDENPLYLFDCRSDAMKSLIPNGYFPEPPIFATKDLFKVFEECRPDHSWLITGPERSGSTFHKDPNSTDAWNVVLEGSKLWVMLPVGMRPPGVFVSEDESEVISPVGLAEWVKSGFWNDTIQISDEATLDTMDKSIGSGGFRTCVVGITFKNECMYVPSGWWHMVINLEDSVAFTANFVPPCKINKVLNFMKHKPDQVSGFRHDLLHRKLTEFLKEHPDLEGGGNLTTLKEYLSREDLRNNDEDVGELKGTGCMPVFEAMVEFLKANGYAALIDEQSINTENVGKEEGKSQSWDNLVKEGKEEGQSGFSFGFDFED